MTARPVVPQPSISVSCVVLTMGDRPAELARALESLRAQRGDVIETVVVGNGVALQGLPGWVQTISLPQNLGIPGGRNVGFDATHGEVVLFLDDDGWYPDDGVVDRLREVFAADPRLGIVSLRIVDPETGQTQRRHVPRLRAEDSGRSSLVTTFLGGAAAIRRDVVRECGGLPADFFFGHEETDLAWRALDHGWDIRYEASAVMCHPRTSPARHDLYYRTNARNRVWLARRNLPAPLIPAYLGVWTMLTLLRVRQPHALWVWARGFAEGWRKDGGPRHPMSWRTVARMTRLGRPPII